MPKTWQGSSEEESQPWREREWKEEKRKERVQRQSGGVQDARTEGSRTTTENPLSLGLYPTTPLAKARAQPIPPLCTAPCPTTTTPPPSLLMLNLSKSSLIETNGTHLCLKWRKSTGERHLCCTVTGGLIEWMMGNLGQICKPRAALHCDECNVLDCTLTATWLSWDGMLINAWRAGGKKGVCVCVCM